MAALARVCSRNFLAGASSPLPRSVTETRRPMLAAPLFSSPYSSYSPNSSSNKVVDVQSKEPSSSSSSSSSSSLSAADDSRSGRRGLQLWRNSPWINWNLLPFRSRNSTTGLGCLGNALVQASNNLNNLLKNFIPSQLLGRVKEDDKSYKLRFEVPGLGKKDLKITVEDGFLVINGEHKEEDKGYDDDEDYEWYSQRYYNTSLLLPSDAQVEGVKAEVKDGVLYVTIPRSQEMKRDVKEVEIH